jgi:transcriptional regulator with XRE-family HTH domain
MTPGSAGKLTDSHRKRKRQKPRDPRPIDSPTEITPAHVRVARQDLGRQLAVWRGVAGMRQVDLARRTGYSRSTIAAVETGKQNTLRSFWQRADRALGADGTLMKAFDQVAALVRDYEGLIARAREKNGPQRTRRLEPNGDADLSAPTVPDSHECACRRTVARWGAREARALREAMRLTVRAFADYLGVTSSTVSSWESRQTPRSLRLSTQDMLDQALQLADADVRTRFWQLLSLPDDAADGEAADGETVDDKPVKA